MQKDNLIALSDKPLCPLTVCFNVSLIIILIFILLKTDP